MLHGNAPAQPHVTSRDDVATVTSPDRFRAPTAADGAALWRLAGASGTLEVNSAYTYLMLGDHFSGTCVIAERDGTPTGFVAAFLEPRRPDTVFVWQIGVSPAARGRGFGTALLKALLHQDGCAGVRYLEANVAPSNRASEALFRGFARACGADFTIDGGYPRELFPDATHEPERLFRIGPLRAPAR